MGYVALKQYFHQDKLRREVMQFFPAGGWRPGALEPVTTHGLGPSRQVAQLLGAAYAEMEDTRWRQARTRRQEDNRSITAALRVGLTAETLPRCPGPWRKAGSLWDRPSLERLLCALPWLWSWPCCPCLCVRNSQKRVHPLDQLHGNAVTGSLTDLAAMRLLG